MIRVLVELGTHKKHDQKQPKNTMNRKLQESLLPQPQWDKF